MQHIRPTYAEISIQAIEHNVLKFYSKLNSTTKLMAVVKADGYGHGAVEVAKAALRSGASHLAVAFIDEAISLRQAGIHDPILILGYTPTDVIPIAARMNVMITIYSLSQMKEIILSGLTHRIGIHIKIDTGMSRLGVNTYEEVLAIAKLINSCSFTKLEGVFTHFADADGLEKEYTERQFSKFNGFLQMLKANRISYGLAHCCNSAAILRFPAYHLDMVRLGIGMYGLQPLSSEHSLPNLIKAMTVYTKISSIKRMDANTSISYGLTYITSQQSTIAVLPIGYADGVNRRLSNQGYVVVNQMKAPIVGRICMDQIMIDVTHIADVQIGTLVTVLGKDEDGITADHWATWLNTIHYEVICGISKRVPRLHV